ncbi:hypothetical protein FDECE_7094 [Fusarium decemcellulare]|nr:hypothetical protein FDECE_7094 [Fusarium decemcellulare]
MEATGPRVLTYGYNERIFPSTISIKDGRYYVGKHDITNHPSDVQFFHDLKRILGRNSEDGQLEADIKKWNLPFELDDKGYPYCMVGDEKVRPVELVALIIMRAKKIIEDATGGQVERYVITVPAYFSNAQRQATRDAAAIAGIATEALELMNEPTAVAVAQLWKSDEAGKFLVIDVGGGTTDCSRVSLSISHRSRTFVVEATSGDNALGGNDSLHALARLFEKKVDGIPYNELLGLCEEAKKRDDDPIQIQARGQLYTVTKAAYRKAIDTYVNRVKKVAMEAFAKETLAGVLLAGGASLQKDLESCLKELLKDHTFLLRRPASEVVAEGAAIKSETDGILVTDVTSRSIGINTQRRDKGKDDIMRVVVERNTPLPTSRTCTFTAVDDKETEIHLFEGEHAKSSKNNSLGVFCIAASAGEELKVKITVTIEAEIRVEAFSATDSKKLTVKRKDFGLTDSEIDAMKLKAIERFASGDAVPPKRKTKKRKRSRQQF